VLLRVDGNVAERDGVGLPLAGIREDLEFRGRAEMESEGFSLDGLTVQTVLDMRYAGQSHELPVTTDSLDREAFLSLFHQAHHERYGHSDPSRAVEVVNLRLKLVLPKPQTKPGRRGKKHGAPAPRPQLRGQAWFDGSPVPTDFFGRASLARGSEVHGPAVITQMDATTVVPPKWRARVDAALNLLLEPA